MDILTNKTPLYHSGEGLLLFFLFIFQMPFQDHVYILRQRTAIILCLVFDFLKDISIDGNADSFF